MNNSLKMKRMSVSDTQMVFPAIGKEEQALYIGKYKYVLNEDGTVNSSVDDNNNSTATVEVYGKTGSMQMSLDDFLNIRFGKNTVSESGATKFFDFMHQRSKYEWGKKKNKNGGYTVWTDKYEGKIDPKADSNTAEFTHSQPGSGLAVPSDYDKTTAKNCAEKGYDIKWTVAARGVYQPYNQYGATGSAYTYGYAYPY